VIAVFVAASLLSAAPLTKAQVRALVQPTEAQVKSCASAAGVHGVLRVTFQVNADGSVSDFRAKAPHESDEAAKCAQDAIGALKFPASSNGRASKYRFQLGGAAAHVSVTAAGNGIDDAFHAADFSACKKAAKQTVRVKLTVGVDGSPGGVTTRGKHAKDDVGSCVADLVSKLRFPAQTRPLTIEKTVKLSAQ
jgi:hypothetical protein